MDKVMRKVDKKNMEGEEGNLRWEGGWRKNVSKTGEKHVSWKKISYQLFSSSSCSLFSFTEFFSVPTYIDQGAAGNTWYTQIGMV